MAWDLKSDRPIYSQLIEQIQLKIVSGVYPAGSKLPSVRDMASDASVNPNTMQRALAELENEGLLYSQRTNGRFVTEDEGGNSQIILVKAYNDMEILGQTIDDAAGEAIEMCIRDRLYG